MLDQNPIQNLLDAAKQGRLYRVYEKNGGENLIMLNVDELVESNDEALKIIKEKFWDERVENVEFVGIEKVSYEEVAGKSRLDLEGGSDDEVPEEDPDDH